MNVDGTIILDRAEDVLYIPSNALQRGNVVYVKDTSLTEEQKAAYGSEDTGSTGTSGEGMPEGGPEDGPEEDGGLAPDINIAVDGMSEGGAPDTSSSAGGGESAQRAMPRRSDVPEGFTAVPVETGLVSDDYVEILSGLSEGQEVYVSDSADSGMGMMFGFGGGMGGPGGGGPGGGPRG